MEAGALDHRPTLGGGSVESARAAASANPGRILVGLLVVAAVALSIVESPSAVAQRSLFGLVSGSYLALGAVGLTLVYGILKLVNFAHGDFLTLGAYFTVVMSVTVGVPLIAAVLVAIGVTAAFAQLTELVLWRPMRRKRAGMLQLLVMAIGLAFVVRYGIQLIAGARLRTLDVASVRSVEFLGLRIGLTQLVVLLVGVVVILGVAAVLRYTALGKQMRALSDNFSLAETTGVDTNRIVTITWLFAGSLAGLAGVLVVIATGTVTPVTGFGLLLPIFAATILGGIGSAYGALVGGFVIGLSQEWSTLVIDSRWKVSVSFAILILVLMVRPQGIFGRRQRVT